MTNDWLTELDKIQEKEKRRTLKGKTLPKEIKRLLRESQALQLLQDIQAKLLNGKGVIQFFESVNGYDLVIALLWAGSYSNPQKPDPDNEAENLHIFVGISQNRLWVNGKPVAKVTPQVLQASLLEAINSPGQGAFQPPRPTRTTSAKFDKTFTIKYLVATSIVGWPFLLMCGLMIDSPLYIGRLIEFCEGAATLADCPTQPAGWLMLLTIFIFAGIQFSGIVFIPTIWRKFEARPIIGVASIFLIVMIIIITLLISAGLILLGPAMLLILESGIIG